MRGPSQSGSVVVIGAGLIGLVSAYYLRQAGLAVTVVERGSVGGGASRGNAGLVCPAISDPLPAPGVIRHELAGILGSSRPLVVDPLALPGMAGYLVRFARHATSAAYERGRNALGDLNQRTYALYDELVIEGVVPALASDGYLLVSRSKETAAASQTALAAMAERGCCEAPGPLLGPNDIARLEPGLAGSVSHGFVVPGQRWMDPSAAVNGLVAALRARGVRIVEGAEVDRLVQTSSEVVAVTSAGQFAADRVVVAAGVWTEPIIRTLGIRLGMTPGRGYSFSVVPAIPPRRPIHLLDHHVVATPMGDRLRLAGTMEFARSGSKLNPRRIQSIAAAAAGYFGNVDWAARTDEWSAARPMTPDGLPLIGELPGHPLIVVATGHNMLGLTLAPSTGKAIAELMTMGQAEVDLTPFAPTRFGSRWSLVRG